jgi:hypothetical protein
MFKYFFQGPGFVYDTLTDEQMLPIQKEIDSIQDDFSKATPFNKNLAGNIEKEYQLFDSFKYVESLVLPYCREYQETFNYPQAANIPLALTGLWVNFQKAGEFNPVHDHVGLYSFVIWNKIPYKIEDEINTGPGVNSNYQVAGNFTFFYTNPLGEIITHNIPADETMKNRIILFPSKLKHSVYPFYSSDEYRITVAGNFGLQLPGSK